MTYHSNNEIYLGIRILQNYYGKFRKKINNQFEEIFVAKLSFEVQYLKCICLKFMLTKGLLLRPQKYGCYEALLSYHLLWDTLHIESNFNIGTCSWCHRHREQLKPSWIIFFIIGDEEKIGEVVECFDEVINQSQNILTYWFFFRHWRPKTMRDALENQALHQPKKRWLMELCVSLSHGSMEWNMSRTPPWEVWE